MSDQEKLALAAVAAINLHEEESEIISDWIGNAEKIRHYCSQCHQEWPCMTIRVMREAGDRVEGIR